MKNEHGSTRVSIVPHMMVFAALVLAPEAKAHKGVTGVVKQRMAAMKEMKAEAKQIDQMLEGKTKFSTKRLHRAVDVIRGHSGEKLTKLFPKGSLKHPSEADPMIWKNWSVFEQRALALGHSSDAFKAVLAEQKSNKAAREALLPVYLDIRRQCKNCHDEFRQ